MQQKGKKKPLN